MNSSCQPKTTNLPISITKLSIAIPVQLTASHLEDDEFDILLNLHKCRQPPAPQPAPAN